VGEPAEDNAEDVEERGVVFGATKKVCPLVDEEGTLVGCVEKGVHGDEGTTEAERERLMVGKGWLQLLVIVLTFLTVCWRSQSPSPIITVGCRRRRRGRGGEDVFPMRV